MSVYLTPVTYSDQSVAPSDDGAAWASVVHDGFVGCDVSAVSTAIRLSAGRIIACGRIHRVASQTDFAMTESSGYARLVLTIDMSQSVAHVAALDVQYASSEAGFPSLLQEDINGSGTTYKVALCLASLSNSVPTILWKLGPAHGKGKGLSVSLPASWDANGDQVVRVDGVTANTNVICTYSYAGKNAFLIADIDAADQGLGWIKFHASTPPSAAVTVQLLLL